MSNARHWTAPDADEIVMHIWPGSEAPIGTPRYLCDDGASLLRPNERRMFEAALAKAQDSHDQAAWVYEGDLSMCVNLDLKGGTPPRWCLSNRERHLNGGFVYETEPRFLHQQRVFEHELPPIFIDHGRMRG